MWYCRSGLSSDSVGSWGRSFTANSSRMLGFSAHIPMMELLALAVMKGIIEKIACLVYGEMVANDVYFNHNK